jgi:hypothetical protein
MSTPPLAHGTGFHLGWTNRTAKAVRPSDFYGVDVLPESNTPLPCCCHHVIYTWGDGTHSLGNCRSPVQTLEESLRASPSQQGNVIPDAAISSVLQQNPWPRYWPSTAGRGHYGTPLQGADEVKASRVTHEEFSQITGTYLTEEQLADPEQFLRVNPGMSFTRVSFGVNCAVAIDRNGELWGWGASATAATTSSQSAGSVQYSVFGVPYNRAQGSFVPFGDTNVFLSPKMLTRGEYVAATHPTWANLRFLDCALGNAHALFIDEHERLWVSGLNNKGQLGDGTTQSLQFAKILGDKKWKSIAAADNYSVAIDEDGHLYFWGEELIRGLAVLTPRRVFGWLGEVSIISGGSFSPPSATSAQPIRVEYTFASPDGNDGVPAVCRGVRFSGTASPPSIFTSSGPLDAASLAFVDPGNGYTSQPTSLSVNYVQNGSQVTSPSFSVVPQADNITWAKVKAYGANRVSVQAGQITSDRGGVAALTEDGRLFFWSPSSSRSVATVPGALDRSLAVIQENVSGGAYSSTLEANFLLPASSLAAAGHHPLDDTSQSHRGRFCSPTQIASGVVEFSIGANHIVARLSNGGLVAAGSNSRGQCAASDARATPLLSSVYTYSGQHCITDFHALEGVLSAVVQDEQIGFAASFAAGDEVSLAVTSINPTGSDYLSSARQGIEGDRFFGNETITPEVALVGCGRLGSICGSWGVSSMLRSGDGATWTRNPTIGGYSFSTCAYGNGVFFASSETGHAMRSTDGTTWDRITTAPALISVAFGNGVFVGLSQNAQSTSSYVYRSTDAQSWSRVSGIEFLTGRSVSKAIAFGNGLFLVLDAGRVRYSANGLSWSSGAQTSGSASTAARLSFAGSYFFSSHEGSLFRTTDGLSWTQLSLPAECARSWESVSYGNGRYVAVSASAGSRLLTALTLNDSVARRYGDDRTAMTSPDGTTWTSNSGIEATAGLNRQYVARSVVWAGDRFLCAGTSGGPSIASGDADIGNARRILSSSDGVSWTLLNHPNVVRCGLLCHGDGVTVALPMAADVMELQGIWNYGAAANQDFNWRSVFAGRGVSANVAAIDGVALACRVPLSSDTKPWQS